MKLDRVLGSRVVRLSEVRWVLEMVEVLIALVVFSVGPRERNWVVASWVALLFPFLLRWSVTGRLSRSTAFDVPWALLLVGGVVGLWASYDAGLSAPILLMLAASVSLYYVVVNVHQPRAVAVVATGIGFVASVYFLAQYRYIVSWNKSDLASLLGQATSSLFPRLGSWGSSPNSVASLLEGLIPLGLALTMTRQSRGWRIAGTVATLVMGMAVLSTASRGAWIALLVGGLIWLASWRRQAAVVVVVAALVLAGVGCACLAQGARVQDVPLIGPVMHDLFARPDRLDLYRGSVRLIQDVPLTGIGPGEVFALNYSRYVLMIWSPFLTYPHNLYLTVWLGQGLLGVIGIGWLLIALTLLVVRERKWGEWTALFQGAWIGVTIILLHGLFDARQYVDLWTMWPLFVLLGLVVSTVTCKSETRPAIRRTRRIAQIALGLLFTLVAGGVLLWRPAAAVAYANLGAVQQAKAQLADLPDGAKDAYLRAAIANYQRAVELDPHNRTANLRLGNLAVDEGRYVEGVTYLETVWRASPRDPTARKALGLACVWRGDIERAARLLAYTKDIAAELDTWSEWHHSEGRDQLAVNARQTVLILRPPHYRCGTNCAR